MKLASLIKVLIIIFIFIALFNFISLFMYNSYNNNFKLAVHNQVLYKQLGLDLINASDFLTAQAKNYVQSGEIIYYDAYMNEVHNVRTRENVVERLKELGAPQNEIDLVTKAAMLSNTLEQLERDAFEAVVKGDFKLANQLIFGEKYKEGKQPIIDTMNKFQEKMNQRAEREANAAQEVATLALVITIVLISISVLSTIFSLFIILKFIYKDELLRKEYEAQRNKYENELYEAVLTAKEASEAKSAFLTNMSHEIRTPMNAIIGMSELLLTEQLTERQENYVRDISVSSHSLLSIINDILDLSKIEAGKLELNPIDYDFHVFIDNIRSIFKFVVEKKGLEYKFETCGEIPRYLFGDDIRLRQVLTNICGNAVKFTETGYIRIVLTATDNTLTFEIQDTGIGIRQEDIPKLFNSFAQADLQKNRNIKGAGLGLAISKSFVEMMGGSISVDSVYGAGTVFIVTIPNIAGDENAISYEAKNTNDKNFFAPTAKILVVDDNEVNLKVAEGLLNLYKINATTVLSGKEAIDLVRKNDYDVVFMDHMMPEMDGVEAMKLIRKLGDKYRDLPIIALTANAVNESRNMLLASGMNDFLSKPIDKNALTDILQKWLPAHKIEIGSKSAEPEQDAPYSDILSAAAKIPGLDIKLALGRISGLQHVLEKSLNQMAQVIDDRLKKMDDCLSGGDLHNFSIIAHGLKGALANIGAVRNSELAAELEIASKAANRELCLTKFPLFADTIEGFGNELKAIFTKTETKTENKPSGDKAFLVSKIDGIIDCLNRFEAADASGLLAELEQFTFGAEADAMLNDAKDMIKSFKYKKAVPLLRKLRDTGGL